MLVIDPKIKGLIDTISFTELFGLTTAEQSICQLLAEGSGAREIAEKRNTGFETVRGRIKSVQAKTRTREKSELVRLALSINLPIDKP